MGVRRALSVLGVLGALPFLVAAPAALVRLWRPRPWTDAPGVTKFSRATERVLRGAAPTPAGYRTLAAEGVTTVIDLRAEAADVVVTEGIRRVRVPIRDGQAPGDRDLATVRTIVASASGPVFVHCSAGVGRTGSIVATLRCDAGTSPRTALAEALSFGPLSLEQQAFVLRGGRSDRSVAGVAIVALSRVADAPRRAWSRVGSRLRR